MDEKEGRCDEREKEGSMKKSKIVHNMEKGKEIGKGQSWANIELLFGICEF